MSNLQKKTCLAVTALFIGVGLAAWIFHRLESHTATATPAPDPAPTQAISTQPTRTPAPVEQHTYLSPENNPDPSPTQPQPAPTPTVPPPSPPPTSNKNLRAWLAQFKNSPDPAVRQSAMRRVLDALSEDNADEVHRAIGRLSPKNPHFKEFHALLGALQGERALARAARTHPRSLGATLAGWASVNPDAALGWRTRRTGVDFVDGEGAEGLDRALDSGLLEGLLIGGHEEEALALIYAAGDDNWSRGNNLMRQATEWNMEEATREQTMAWVEGLPAGPMKGAAAGRIIETWGADDVFSQLDWALSMEEPGARRPALSAAFAKWGSGAGEGDPVDGAEMIDGIEDETDRDFAINGYASGLVWSQPDLAIELAKSIKTPGLRKAAVKRISDWAVKAQTRKQGN